MPGAVRRRGAGTAQSGAGMTAAAPAQLRLPRDARLGSRLGRRDGAHGCPGLPTSPSRPGSCARLPPGPEQPLRRGSRGPSRQLPPPNWDRPGARGTGCPTRSAALLSLRLASRLWPLPSRRGARSLAQTPLPAALRDREHACLFFQTIILLSQRNFITYVQRFVWVFFPFPPPDTKQ